MKEGYLIARELAASNQKDATPSVVLIDFCEPVIKGKIAKINYGF